MPQFLLRLLLVLLAAAGCALFTGGIRAQSRGDEWYECAPMGCQSAFDDLISEISKREGVNSSVVKAVVWHESRFDARKVREGGYGLMQIGEGTGAEWAATHGVESWMAADLLDARTNLQVGTWYLRQALSDWREADEPLVFALVDYFAGKNAIAEWAGESRRSEDLLRAIKGFPAGDFVDRVLKRARFER